jgi:hypothetical protein
MFKRIVVFTLSILSCAFISFADGREEIESMCTEKWGSNHQMRVECIETQLSAADFWIKNYFNKYVATHLAAVDKDPESTYLEDEAFIVYECTKNFEDSEGRYDYQMVLDCCDEQFKAFYPSKQ